jgi:hypothetical protein
MFVDEMWEGVSVGLAELSLWTRKSREEHVVIFENE